MKQVGKIYLFFTMVLMLVFAGAFKQEVRAAEGDVEVKVYSKDTSSWTNDLSTYEGISFDAASNTLTLNGYNGGGIIISSINGSVKDVTINVLGNNTATYFGSDLNLLTFQNVNGTIKGSGTLNLDLSTEYGNSYFEQVSNGSVTIDGATINMLNSNGTLWCNGDFTMKSGTLNIDRYPKIQSGDTTEFYYYEAISSVSTVNILGGNINIKYIYPTGYENVKFDFNCSAAIISDDYNVTGGKVTLSVANEIKEKYDVSVYDYNLVEFRFSYEDGSMSNVLETIPKDISGVTWDVENLTLTLDGYNGGEIWIYTRKKDPVDIKINVVGDNTINPWAYKYDVLYTNGVNVTFTGKGTLNIKIADGYDEAIYLDGGTLTIDGPVINFVSQGYSAYYPMIEVAGFEMKSGYLYFELEKYANGYYEGAIYAWEKGIKISGGTIVIDYKDMDENSGLYNMPIIIYGDEDESYLNTENCVIVFIGDVDILTNEKLIGHYNYRENPDERTFIGDGTIIMYTSNLDYIEKVDISKFKASLSENNFEYDGKEKKPEVKVGGLVEGWDFTVTYSNNVNPGTATAKVTGKGIYKGTIELNFVINKAKESKTDESKADGPKKGSTIKDKKYIYKVTKAGSKDGSIVGELKVTGLKKKSLTQIKIAAKVKIGGVTYKVTSVGAKAFKGNKKITKVFVGKNVKSIGANAFAKCTKLKQASINSKALTSIGKNAFNGDKKLKKVIVKSTKLKKVGKKALAGTSKKLVVKVPKAKKKAYTKLFKKAGNKKVKVK